MKKVVYALLVSSAFISGSQGIQSQSNLKNKLQRAALKSESPDDWIKKIQQQQDAIVASWKNGGDSGGDIEEEDCVVIPTLKPTECVPEGSTTAAPTTELPTPSQQTTEECVVIPTVAPTTELPTPSQQTTEECIVIPTVAPTTELPTPSQETTEECVVVPTVAPTTELPTPSQQTTEECIVIPTVAPTTELPTPSQQTTEECIVIPTVAPTTELPTPSQQTTEECIVIPTVAPTTELPTPSQQTTEECIVIPTVAPTTELPTPSQETTVPPSQETTKPEECIPPVDCTEENTPNIYINEEEDCVWEYNTEEEDFECVKKKCKWSFNATECSWNCEEEECAIVIPDDLPIPSEDSDKGNKCKVKCEDFEALELKVKSIESVLNIDGADIGDSGALDELNDRIDEVDEKLSNMQAMIEQNARDIEALKNQTSSGSGSTEDAVQATLSSIQENGAFFGDRWWIGQQMDNLYAIDLQEQTYYTFQAGVNATL